MITLPVKLLTEHATLPTYGSDGAAGMDLYANFTNQPENTYRMEPGERLAVPTGIAVALPDDHYGRIAPRSGLAFKQGVDVLAGVIDNDYRGEIKAILINLGGEPVMIKNGDRVAQMVITPYCTALPEQVDELPATERNASGFGSTGK